MSNKASCCDLSCFLNIPESAASSPHLNQWEVSYLLPCCTSALHSLKCGVASCQMTGSGHRCYFQIHFTSVNITLLDQSFIPSEFVILEYEPCKCVLSFTSAAHPPRSLIHSLYRQASVIFSYR